MSKLVTIGETMVSFVPQTPAPLRFGASFAMRIAGAESNTAIGVSTYGHSVSFISRVGNDGFGQYILRMLRADGIDVSGVLTDAKHQTGLMFKEPLSSQKTGVHYYRNDSAASSLTPKDLDEALIQRAQILHFTGITPILSRSCLETIYAAVEIAKAGNTLVSFDPNIRFKLWNGQDYKELMRDFICRADIILTGRDEASYLYDIDEIDKLHHKLSTDCASLRYLAIKDGETGAWVSDTDKLLFVPAANCNCVDSIGAGDAFNAGFISGILGNEPLERCASIGAIFGARATETTGDTEGFLTKKEVDAILNNLSGTPLR